MSKILSPLMLAGAVASALAGLATTAAAPHGEYVTLDKAQNRQPAAPEAADSGWLNSSVELERGATVTEYVWDR